MTQSRIGTLQAVKTILEEIRYKGIEHPYDHYAILSELEEMIEDLKSTEKQLIFIKVIEEEWGHNPFTGATKEEARHYISQAVKEKERNDFEDEAMGYGLPNQ